VWVAFTPSFSAQQAMGDRWEMFQAQGSASSVNNNNKHLKSTPSSIAAGGDARVYEYRQGQNNLGMTNFGIEEGSEDASHASFVCRFYT